MTIPHYYIFECLIDSAALLARLTNKSEQMVAKTSQHKTQLRHIFGGRSILNTVV